VATNEGWRATLASLGYHEISGNDEVGPGEFRLGASPWSIHPRGGPPILVDLDGREVEKLRHRDEGVAIAGWDFQLPDISVLSSLEVIEPQPQGPAPPFSTSLSFQALPASLIHSLLSRHDERFFEHTGIDPRLVLANTWRRIRWNTDSRPRATITQHLSSTMLQRHDPSPGRSIQQVLLTWVLECRYSKEQLLAGYLNKASFEGRDGNKMVGIHQAAAHWFQKEPPALAPEEAIFLTAALVTGSPGKARPDLSTLRERRDEVVRAMLRLEQLSPAVAAAALKAEIPETSAGPLQRNAPWFVDEVRRAETTSRDELTAASKGLELRTTLLPPLQRAAEKAAEDVMEQLRIQHGKLLAPGTGIQLALVVMEPQTGAVQALVGGRDYRENHTNHAFAAARPPGSAFRPLVLASSAADLSPGISNGKERLGRTSPQRLRATAESMGIRSPMTAQRSLLDGQQPVTAVDLAVAMSTLANGGLRPEPHLLLGTRSPKGAWIDRRLPSGQAVLDPLVALTVTRSLMAGLAPETLQKVRATGFELPFVLQGGRSPDGRDSWIVGYTPDLVAVAWLGRTGISDSALPWQLTALPLWARFMAEAAPHLSGKPFSPLDGPQPAEGTQSEDAGQLGNQPGSAAPNSGAQRNLAREDENRRDAEQNMLRELERSLH